ncbi:hypothetical protein ZIOFF_012599 [Zingiber officinale]|uniref:Protein kinase domain-containing protein n=1 Tax=Zingiber officinale TaxID=94328 RepID=A0A8J5LLM5_ZINOF|nr:hypothetical protein ZIOFF_012599 [Zingiber officinale]
MVDSVDVVLEFLRKNRFTNAEAALKGELNARPDLNGFLQKHLSVEKEESGRIAGEVVSARQLSTNTHSVESSKECIVKDIEVGGSDNGFKNKKGFTFCQDRGCGSVDLYPLKFNSHNSNSDSVSKDTGVIINNFADLLISEGPKHHHSTFVPEKIDRAVGTDTDVSVEQRSSCAKDIDRCELEVKPEISQPGSCKDKSAYSRDHFVNDLWVKNEDSLKGCSVKTVFPFSVDMASSSCGGLSSEKKELNHKDNGNNVIESRKEHLGEINNRSYLSGKSQENAETKGCKNFDLLVNCENHRDELPRLPPVRLKSEDKLLNTQLEEKADQHRSGMKLSNADSTFMIGSFLDVPVGQEVNSSGGRRTIGSSWLSVSQGIAEDTSDLVSGFATIGDESNGYPNEYWDSDEYEDDDDVGYMRQPIEDESWFLAHEIDYPSDNEKGTQHGSVPDHQDQAPRNNEDDDQSFAEEDSYLSGDQYFLSKNVEQVAMTEESLGHKMAGVFGRTNENDLIAQYDGQLMDAEELSLMHSEPVWQGFVTQNNELIMLGDGQNPIEVGQSHNGNSVIQDDQHSSIRSIGVGINSDAADIGSEIRDSLIGGSSDGDIEFFPDHDLTGFGKRRPQCGITNRDLNKSKKEQISDNKRDGYILAHEKDISLSGVSADGTFSFQHQKTSSMLEVDSEKSLGSGKPSDAIVNTFDECANGIISEDLLATWRKKSSDSSPLRGSRDEKTSDAVRSRNSSASSEPDYAYDETDSIRKRHCEVNEIREEDPGAILDDEVAALQEQLRQIKAQEEEFETFYLKIVHRKNRHADLLPAHVTYRTGFEEDKNFHVVLNSVIAGRYHVTEYLGSAAFSKAIQAHDLHTGMDVCVKIIKNNKDFFDQSLDEIKLLKFVNKHDPADKYHILRLYDYFYYREHLLIVCELLKANLYEFHKFNRESGGEVYFTMPRLQSITIQCLEALQFLHGLGLIHCDLKPENILVKSYSRCEVKVIDLGSSCFETDHLCSYVQSRSYRAPEVILGLPYDKKIDIWSLGCILAELCTGNVLFQNDSPATLLARVIGIIHPIDQGMLAKGHDTYKYFTKNHMLYERNQETNKLEYLIPKKTSLRHRLPMGDQGFIDFIAYLLEVNPKKRPNALDALNHPWLSYPYEPISS